MQLETTDGHKWTQIQRSKCYRRSGPDVAPIGEDRKSIGSD